MLGWDTSHGICGSQGIPTGPLDLKSRWSHSAVRTLTCSAILSLYPSLWNLFLGSMFCLCFFSASCHILLKGRFIQALHHLSFPFPASSLLSSSLSWLFYGMFFSFISFEFHGSFLFRCLTLLTTPANSKFLEKSAYLNFPLKWQLIFSISEFICLSLSVHFALFCGALQTLTS